MSNYLHIISFDIPYPPTYGGAIDVYSRIEALAEKGVNVILHCFEYNREKSTILDNLCHKVYYYKRSESIFNHLSVLPYTVFSRKNDKLLQNLINDNYPILFEGLMSCYYIDSKALKNRMKIYREANVEHDYYYQLFKVSKLSVSKMYYIVESLKFSLFERKLRNVQIILAISEVDRKYYSEKFTKANVEFIPCFHSNKELICHSELGSYLLYHGNLSVPENQKAVNYLCKNVFSKLNYNCKIAGMNPDDKIIQMCEKYSNIELIINPNESDMNELIINAQVNVLVTFQTTGLKIKLLNTLFAGKHVIVNDKMLMGSGLESLCVVANNPDEQIEACKALMIKPFNIAEIEKRVSLLIPNFTNSFLAAKIINYLK